MDDDYKKSISFGKQGTLINFGLIDPYTENLPFIYQVTKDECKAYIKKMFDYLTLKVDKDPYDPMEIVNTTYGFTASLIAMY